MKKFLLALVAFSMVLGTAGIASAVGDGDDDNLAPVNYWAFHSSWNSNNVTVIGYPGMMLVSGWGAVTSCAAGGVYAPCPKTFKIQMDLAYRFCIDGDGEGHCDVENWFPLAEQTRFDPVRKDIGDHMLKSFVPILDCQGAGWQDFSIRGATRIRIYNPFTDQWAGWHAWDPSTGTLDVNCDI